VGGADHHRMPLVEGIDRLVLKRAIERKRKELLKGRHLSRGNPRRKGGR